jgi:nitrile hydratase subunit alpha
MVHDVGMTASAPPALGAKVIAKAWVDSGFKRRLLDDALSAIGELGIESHVKKLVAVENTAQVHNVIVCTLCSCYPSMLLGSPPDWYKSTDYRSRMVVEPRRVLKEFGLELQSPIKVQVHDSTEAIRYIVIPQRPSGTEQMGEAELAGLLTRDSMVGVAQADTPSNG